MAKKNRRKKHRQRLETPRATPSHFIRLERLRVIIDESLKWYVVRVNARREERVKEGLEKAGFATYQPIDVQGFVRHRGRVYELKRRPAAGYLFVGVPKDRDGHAELWDYHDRVVLGDKPFVAVDQNGEEIVCTPGADPDRPFYRVMGPFGSKQLQRFADKIRPPFVAALWHNGEVLGHFPALQAGIVDGERLLLTNVMETLETRAA